MGPVSARHGHSSSHGAWSMVLRAPRIIRPQDGSGGTTPSPRKDSPLSSTIAEATVSENCTSSGGATFGSTVRPRIRRSEEHTSELQSLMRISHAVFCLKKKNNNYVYTTKQRTHQDKNK